MLSNWFLKELMTMLWALLWFYYVDDLISSHTEILRDSFLSS